MPHSTPAVSGTAREANAPRTGVASGFWVLILSVLVGFPGSTAAARDLTEVLPGLRTAPVPPAITEGRRLSYLVEVATVPSAYYDEWVDNAGTTNRYDIPSPSGRGYTQVDVVGLTPQYAALRVQPWLFHNFTGPLVPLFGADEALVCPAGGGDWYAHPEVLATVGSVQQPGLVILRLPLRVGGRWYDALRIQSGNATATQVLCYDLTTGYLLYKAGAVTGEQGVTVSQASFVGSRQLALPWLGGVLPSWVGAGIRLRYEGTHTAVAPGPFPFSLPLSAELAITASAPDWFLYEQTTTLGSLPGMPPTVERKTLVSGIPGIAPLCLPLPFPAELRQGKVLDQDEITGGTLTVQYAGVLNNGRQGLAMRLSAGDAAWAETVYDAATGVALALQTYSGASPLYYTATDLHLTELPPEPAAPPHLSLARRTGSEAVVVTWTTEAGRRTSLEFSTDGARSWTVVPGRGDQVGTGMSLSHEIQHPEGNVLYRVRAW